MAAKNRVKIRLESTSGTKYSYTTTKNPKNTTKKLEFTKFDPIARKHCTFQEKKMK